MHDVEHTTIIVHRDSAVRRRLSAALAARGRACLSASQWHEIEPQLHNRSVDAVFLQVARRGNRPAADVMAEARRRFPHGDLIILCPDVDPDVARAALRVGARDLLEEPLDEGQLDHCLSDAAERLSTLRDTHMGLNSLNAGGPLAEHSAFLDTLATLRAACRRRGEPLSLMMFDLDRFRDCNEEHSPAFGDHVLAWFARIVARMCRRSDVVARYESDRFAVALPDASADQATALAHRTRQAMQNEPVMMAGRPYELTVSIGIVESTLGFIETEQQLLRRVRLALEQAKHEGGNRTVGWTDLVSTQTKRRDLNELSVQDVSRWIARTRQQLRCTYVESTRALVAAVEAKDPHTRKHSLTVSAFAEAIGRRMKLNARMLETLRAAALLHDIGKIGVPDAILTKEGALSTEEFSLIQRHPETALDILGHVSFLADERPLILHHHEHYDGSGYPAGLCGDQIPIGARVLTVADTLDAMFSPRSYKRAYSLERVRAELHACAGSHFDPNVAKVALEWLDEGPDIVQAALGSHSMTTR